MTLPFYTFTLLGGDRTLRFKSGERYIECDLTRYECAPSSYKVRPASEVASADSQWVAYVKDHNVWVNARVGRRGDATHDRRRALQRIRHRRAASGADPLEGPDRAEHRVVAGW